MGSTKIYHPDQDHAYGSQPIARGGTGSRTKEEAGKKLGAVSKQMENKPMGVATLDTDGFIKEQHFPVELGDIRIPTLEGPTFIVIGNTYTYYISNYDSSVIYTVNVVGASWTREEDRIYITATGDTVNVAITVNGKVFNVSSASRTPTQPTILYPTENLVIDTVNPIAVATDFVPGVTLEPHLKSRWVLSNLPSLSSPIQDIMLDAATTCQFDNIPLGNDLYMGVQYSSASGFSVMSPTRKFTTQAAQVLAPLTSLVDESDAQEIRIKLNAGLFKTNTVRQGILGVISSSTTSGSVSLASQQIGVDLDIVATPGKPVVVVVDGQTYTFTSTAKQRVLFSRSLTEFTFSKTAGIDSTLRYRLLTASETHASTDWEVSEQANFSTILQSYTNDTVNTSSRTFISLEYGKTYHFRARYRSANLIGAWSSPLSVSTITYIETPAIVSPINNAVNQATSITFTTNTYGGHPGSLTHVSSDWQIFDDLALTNVVAAVYGDTVNKTSFTVNGLEHGKIYYARVRFHAAGVSSEWSAITKITTSNYIAAPTITYPAMNESVYETTFTLQSNAFSALPATQTHTSSDWELALDVGFTGVIQSSYADTTNKTTWSVNNLSYGGSYFARVRYRSGAAVSEWSEVRSVVVSSDISPVITSPANDSLDVPASLVVQLNNPFTQNPSVHVSTTWQVATNADFTNIVYQSAQDTNNKYGITTSALLEGEIYFIRARFHLQNTTSSWSNTVKVTTKVTVVPVIQEPEQGSTVVLESYLGISKANYESTDADTRGSVHWQLSTEASFNTIYAEDTVTTLTYDGSALIYNTLLPLTQYSQQLYIRFRYRIGQAYSIWSSTVSFRTINNRQIRITPALSGSQPYTDWDLNVNGPLVIDGFYGCQYAVEPLVGDFDLEVKMWGAAGTHARDYGGYGGPGGFAKATIPLKFGEVYGFVAPEIAYAREGRYNFPGGGYLQNDNTAGGGGGYAAFYKGTLTHENVLLVAGGGGGAGMPNLYTGTTFGIGAAISVGGSGGSIGDGTDVVYGASRPAGGVGGTQTAAGFTGGPLAGGIGQFSIDYENVEQNYFGYTGAGGGGYYGGGAGVYTPYAKLGTQTSVTHKIFSGGGGGSSYYHPTLTNNATLDPGYVSIVYYIVQGTFAGVDLIRPGGSSDPDRANAGEQGYAGRIVLK